MSAFDPTVEYRSIPGFDGYLVGNDGSVWSCWQRGGSISVNGKRVTPPPRKTEVWKRLKPSNKGTGGYLRIRMLVNGKRGSFQVHRLVLFAFVGPCPEGMECRHFPDPNPENCRLENLSWGTRLENARDKYTHGTVSRGENSGRTKLTNQDVLEIRRRFASGESSSQIAPDYNMESRGIEAIVYRRRWKHLPSEGSDGVKHPLTPDEVREIRQRFANGETRKQIAASCGRSYVSVCTIVKGIYYKDVSLDLPTKGGNS